MLATTTSKIAFKLGVSIFIGVIVVGYSLFSARHIITGPVISIITPTDGETTKSNFIEIKGESENLNYISMNDREIFIDDEGNFKEKILLYPGYNTMKFYGKDKFGRETTKFVRIVAPEQEPPVLTINTKKETSSTTPANLIKKL